MESSKFDASWYDIWISQTLHFPSTNMEKTKGYFFKTTSTRSPTNRSNLVQHVDDDRTTPNESWRVRKKLVVPLISDPLETKMGKCSWKVELSVTRITEAKRESDWSFPSLCRASTALVRRRDFLQRQNQPKPSEDSHWCDCRWDFSNLLLEDRRTRVFVQWLPDRIDLQKCYTTSNRVEEETQRWLLEWHCRSQLLIDRERLVWRLSSSSVYYTVEHLLSACRDRRKERVLAVPIIWKPIPIPDR